MIWPFRRWFIIGFALTSLVVGLVLMRMPRMYQAEAKLGIERSTRFTNDTAFDPETGLRLEFGQLNAVREEILARPVLDAALLASGEKTLSPYAERAIPASLLEKRLQVVTSRDSWALIVTVQAESPDRATKLCAAVIDAYSAALARRRAKLAKEAETLLANQVKESQAKLEASNAAELRYRLEHGLDSGTSESNPLNRRQDQLVQQGIDLDRSLGTVTSIMERVRVAETATDADAGAGAGAGERQRQLLTIDRFASDPRVVSALVDQRNAAAVHTAQSLKFGPKHSRMIEAVATLADRNRRLDEALALVRAALVESMESMEFQKRQVAKSRTESEQELAKLREHLVILQSLREVTNEARELLGKRRTELSRVEFASRMENRFIYVIEPPAASLRAVNRSVPLFAAAATLAGVIVGSLLAGVMCFRSRVVGSLADIQRIAPGQRVLGRIPLMPPGAMMGGSPDRPPVVAETFRRLRSELVNHAPGTVIVVVSSQSGEGKTQTAWRLGHSFARSGQRVLLIDGDLRQPGLSAVAEALSAPGVANLLSGKPAEIRTLGTNLDLLPAGASEINAGDLITPRSVASLLLQLRGNYQRIIIDTSPLGAVADAMAMMDTADSVVLVARARVTDRRRLQETLRTLEPWNDKLLGLVSSADPDVDLSLLLAYTGLSQDPAFLAARASAVGATAPSTPETAPSVPATDQPG